MRTMCLCTILSLSALLKLVCYSNTCEFHTKKCAVITHETCHHNTITCSSDTLVCHHNILVCCDDMCVKFAQLDNEKLCCCNTPVLTVWPSLKSIQVNMCLWHTYYLQVAKFEQHPGQCGQYVTWHAKRGLMRFFNTLP